MAIAAVLAVTLDPALRMLFARIEPFSFRPRFLARLASAALVGTYHAEGRHPKAVIAAAAGLVLASLPAYFKLGSEFKCRR